LELHFADEIETGQIKANATVGRFIYATITGGPGGSNYEPGRIDLAKFWASTRMGWKSTTERPLGPAAVQLRRRGSLRCGT
jgi:hypothetical protein